jgi:hypothetical protein
VTQWNPLPVLPYLPHIYGIMNGNFRLFRHLIITNVVSIVAAAACMRARSMVFIYMSMRMRTARRAHAACTAELGAAATE